MYFVAVQRKQSGPFPESEVRRRIEHAELGPDDLCWCEGWPQWRRIRDAFPTEPPPLPPPPAPSPLPVAGSTPTPPPPATSGLAIASLVCGIGIFVLLPLFFLLAPAAVVLGHVAKARIRRSGGRLAGAGLATAGLILGYLPGSLFLAGTCLFAALFLHESREQARTTAIRSNLEVFWDAADARLRTGTDTEVAFPDVVGTAPGAQPGNFAPVAGENYSDLVVHRGDEQLTITLPAGRTITYYAPQPAGTDDPAPEESERYDSAPPDIDSPPEAAPAEMPAIAPEP